MLKFSKRTVALLMSLTAVKETSLKNQKWCIRKTNSYIVETKSYLLEIKNYILETKNYILETKSYVLQTKNYILETETYILQTNNYILEIKKITSLKKIIAFWKPRATSWKSRVTSRKSRIKFRKPIAITVNETSLGLEYEAVPSRKPKKNIQETRRYNSQTKSCNLDWCQQYLRVTLKK